MAIIWYINRLRSMGPSEIGHRIKEQSKKITSRHKHYEWSDFGAVPAIPCLREAFFAQAKEQLHVVVEGALVSLSRATGKSRIFEIREMLQKARYHRQFLLNCFGLISVLTFR